MSATESDVRGVERGASVEATTWGLMGLETTSSERRTRTLGLGKTVRFFNDRAVPGLGGVWFGKELFLATLGVGVAKRVERQHKRVQNIEVANSVEALACWLALNDNQQNWQHDPRVRGAMKMKGKTDLTFAKVRKPSFYVTQPMRQQTVQPLLELGLVESDGERFNSFASTDDGREFIDAVCDGTRLYNRTVANHLVGWVAGDRLHVVDKSKELRKVLSPLQSMPSAARAFLSERLVTGGEVSALRRRKVMAWVERLRQNPTGRVTWKMKPQELDRDHWEDLHAGGLFFAARDAAIALLDAIESHLVTNNETEMPLGGTLPDAVTIKSNSLVKAANKFLDHKHDLSPGGSAEEFCRECIEPDPSMLICHLVARDGRVLRLRDRIVVPGTAFTRKPANNRSSPRSIEDDGQETEVKPEIILPLGISNRIRNAYLLNIDLRGEMNEWLRFDRAPGEADHDEG